MTKSMDQSYVSFIKPSGGKLRMRLEMRIGIPNHVDYSWGLDLSREAQVRETIHYVVIDNSINGKEYAALEYGE